MTNPDRAMVDATISRRQVLASAGALLSGACLDDDASDQGASRASRIRIEEPEHLSGNIGLAHWFSTSTIEPLLAIASEMYPEVSIEANTFQTRLRAERAIADSLVDSAPPDLFQTVLGDELARYGGMAELESVPSIAAEEDLIWDGLGDLILFKGEPFAVPVSVAPTNAIHIHENRMEDAGMSLDNVSDPIEFLDLLKEEKIFGMVPSGNSRFRLLAQVILGQFGPETYLDISEGALFMEPLRAAIALAEKIESKAVTLSGNSDNGDHKACAIQMYTPAHGIDADAWTVAPFPGTDGLTPVHATGFCLAKRGRDRRSATAVLELLHDGVLQLEIASVGGRLPSLTSHREWPAPLAELLTIMNQSEAIVPAVSTGCGLDSNNRWRAVRLLDDNGWTDQTTLGDELGSILR